MTKIEAVSEILVRCGHRPIEALDTGGDTIPALAERWLDMREREIQRRGWSFNSQREVTLTADMSGKFALPEGVMRIDTDGQNAYRDVSVRGGFLFDNDNNSDVFPESTLVVEYVIQLDFEDLPEEAQEAAIADAAFEFNARHGRPDLAGTIYQQREKAMAALRRYDVDTSDHNILASTDARRVRGRPSRARRLW